MEVGDLLPLGVTLVVVTVALAFGMQVVGDIRNDMDGGAACGVNSSGGSGGTILYTGCPADYNATTNGLIGLSKLTSRSGYYCHTG
jgi:hypothetical protein